MASYIYLKKREKNPVRFYLTSDRKFTRNKNEAQDFSLTTSHEMIRIFQGLISTHGNEWRIFIVAE